VLSYVYDSLNRVVAKIVPERAGKLGKLGQLPITNGFPATLQQDYARYEYTLNGRRLAVVDANGNRAEMTWDGFDRQRRWIFPSNTPGYANQGDYEEYLYDAVGNRTSLRKRDGSTLTYLYDNLNRVIRKTVPERAGLTAAQTRDVFYDYYHALGLQTKARFDNLDGEGVTNYYDQFGLRTTVSVAMGGQVRYVSYNHDDAGNLWRLTHPDGANFYHSYDALGRMTQLLDGPSTSVDDYVVRYGYRAEGPRYAAVRGAGVPGFTSVYYYDALQRPVAISNDFAAAGTDVAILLGYNPACYNSSAYRRYSLGPVIDANGNRAEMTWDGFDRQRRLDAGAERPHQPPERGPCPTYRVRSLTSRSTPSRTSSGKSR
jgi:YD repeat-containing protein